MSVSQIKQNAHMSLLFLVKLFVNNHISIDEFKSGLTLLCQNYRKEMNIKYYGKS